MEPGGSCTLVFYSIPRAWWREPLLNVVAAVAQASSFTHVEIAIGSVAAADGSMTHVCRVFNDAVGTRVRPILCVVAPIGPTPIPSLVPQGWSS
jgi:hypothetical protein